MDGKVIFITIDDEIGDFSEVVEVFGLWIEKKVREESVVMVDLVEKCKSFGEELGRRINKPVFVLKGPGNVLDCEEFKGEVWGNSVFLEIPGVGSMRDHAKIIEYVGRSALNSVIVLPLSAFEEFGLECITRNLPNSAMHEYTFPSGSEIVEENINALLESTLKIFPNVLADELASKLAEKSFFLGELFWVVKDKFMSVPKKISSLYDLVKSTKIDSAQSNSELILIKSSLLKITEQLEKINEKISFYENFKKCDETIELTQNMIEIRSFVYLPYSGSWVIKLANCSEKNLSDIEIYNIENRALVCEIKMVQKKSSVKKRIKINYQNYYGMNLVAAIKGQIVSENFLITPFCILNQTRNGKTIIQVMNKSINIWENLVIVTSNCNTPFNLPKNSLKYNESCELEIPTKYLENARIFLHNGNDTLSNRLIFI